MVTAFQVLTKHSNLSSDDKTRIREDAEKLFREAAESAKVASKNVEEEVKEVNHYQKK